MFVILIPIFFRIIQQKELGHETHKVHQKDITRCESLSGNRYTNNNYSQYLISCEVPGTTFGFYGTTFSGHTTMTGDHMLHIINVNFDLHNCPFTNCGFLSAMIYCHGDEYSYSMQRNTITQCNNKNSPISNSNIVDCDCKTTTIQNNVVTFSDTSNSCRAFSIGSSRNTIFTNNQITNANVGTSNSGSALLVSKSGTGEPIQFSECKFTHCLGGNGAVLSLNDLDFSIEIKETTIEKTKNELNNGFGYLILLNFNGQHVNPEAKFVQCHFKYLESDASGGGSIGLWFKGNKLNMSLLFERSTFENLYYLRSDIGGAITFIKENSNKETHLTISECQFNNCSSLVAGSAICYCAPSQQLTITDTTFKNTYCMNSGGYGGAIFVEYQEQTQPVIIRDCTFENATANNCKGNTIVLAQGGNNAFHLGYIENCDFTDCGFSGFVVYYTIAIVQCVSINIIFTHSNHQCGGIHRDLSLNAPSQIILNGLSKSGILSEKVDRNYVLFVESSSFSQLNQESLNGGALHLVDCGLSCKKSSFKKCLSKSGAGGAIYIKSDNELLNEAILEEVNASDCQASCGGAVFLYNSDVSIKKCNFLSNEAIFGHSNSMVGGSAVFLAVRKGSITDTTFSENKGEGGSLRINNDFDFNQISFEKNSVEINRCKFKIQKDSKCSLFYVAGNGKSSFVLKDCMFTGKLANGAHYIDGQSLVKEAPKLLVKSCVFQCDSMSSLNLDPNNEFLDVDLNNQIFDYEAKNAKISTWKITVATVVPAVAVIVIIVVVAIIIKKKYYNRNTLVDDEVAENLQNSELKQALI